MTTKSETEKKQPDEDVLELPERYHSPGCPMDDDDLEWHEATPVTGPYAGKQIEITRCVKCGGQIEKPIEED